MRDVDNRDLQGLSEAEANHEDRTGLKRFHRYRLPDGSEAVAEVAWDRPGVAEDAPYAGWILDQGASTLWVTPEGRIENRDHQPTKWIASDLTLLGPQPLCAECVWPYAMVCPHRARP